MKMVFFGGITVVIVGARFIAPCSISLSEKGRDKSRPYTIFTIEK